jgi:hypothetical protein
MKHRFLARLTTPVFIGLFRLMLVMLLAISYATPRASAQTTGYNIAKTRSAVTVTIDCQSQNYNIYRRPAASPNAWTQLRTRPASNGAITQFTDTNAVTGETYVYAFWWINANGTESPSEITVNADTAIITKNTAGVVTVAIDCPSGKYDVYRRNSGTIWSATQVYDVTKPLLSQLVDTPPAGKMYLYDFYKQRTDGGFDFIKSVPVHADVVTLSRTLAPTDTSLPSSEFRGRSGVAINYTTEAQVLTDIQRAIDGGFKFVRIDLLQFQALPRFSGLTASQEVAPYKVNGQPNYNATYNFNSWVSFANKIKTYNAARTGNQQEMEVIFTLAGYGENVPKTDAAFKNYWTFSRVDAFQKFAKDATTALKSYPVRFEVWNEENDNYWWQTNGIGAANAPEYRTALDAALAGVNSVSGNTIKVASGGLLYNANNFDTYLANFLTGIFPKPTLPSVTPAILAPSTRLTAVGIHPYRWYNGSRPELRARDLTATNTKMMNINLSKEIWDTELGYPSTLFNTNGDVVRSSQTDQQKADDTYDGSNANARKAQAVYNTRAMLAEWKLNIPVAVLYSIRDKSTSSFIREDNFGLIDVNGYYKDAFNAMITLNNITIGFNLLGESFITETAQSATDYSLPFDSSASLPNGNNQPATGLHILKTKSSNTGQYIIWLDRDNTSVNLKFDKKATVYNMLWDLQGSINGTNSYLLTQKDGPIYIQF